MIAPPEGVTLGELLGRGTFGDVYRASEGGFACAAKRLRVTTPQSILRFKREFRVLAELDHPNLVSSRRLVQAGSDDWWLLMELVEGLDLLTWLRRDSPEAPNCEPTWDGSSDGAPPPSTSPAEPSSLPAAREAAGDRWRSALRQLADGLDALHARGSVHRDVKPGNVRVTAEGRVVLLDFGLVGDPDAPDGATAERLGTPAYMAPEQTAGLSAGPAADWYAVGALLYQAVLGELPGYADGAVRERLAPISDPALRALVADLLERDPARRAGSAQVRAWTGAVASFPTPGSAFVGREREIEALRLAWRDVRAGDPRLVFVAGESGVGKTALVEQHLSTRGDALVLRSRGRPQESVPLRVVDGLVDRLSTWLARIGPHAAHFAPRDLGCLLTLFPALRVAGFPPTTRDRAVPGDPIEVGIRGREALRELLGRVALERPLALVVDDAQWSDSESAALCAGLVGPGGGAPGLLLVVVHRAEERDSAALRAFAALRAPDLSIEVGPLAEAAGRELARQRLPDEPAEVRDAVVAEARGNTFFLEQLLREREACPGVLPAFADVVRRAVERLRPDEVELLRLVCVAGHPVDEPLLGALLGAGTDLRRVVRTLHRAGMLRPTGERWTQVEPFHDRVAETVLAGLGDAERRAYHARFAEMLDLQLDPERVALHAARAGLSARSLAAALLAARRAEEVLAFARAADWYARAAECVNDDDEARGHRARQAAMLRQAGRLADAGRAFVELAERGPHDERAALLVNGAECLIKSREYTGGRALLAAAIATTGVRLPRARLPTLLGATLRICLRGLATAFRRLPRLPASSVSGTRIRAGLAGLGLMEHDPLLAWWLVSLAGWQAERVGDWETSERAAIFTSGIGAFGPAWLLRRSRRDLERRVTRTVSPEARLDVQMFLCLCTIFEGDLAGLELHSVRALTLADELAGQGWFQETCTRGLRLWGHAWTGDHRGDAEAVEEHIARAAAQGEHVLVLHLTAWRGLMLIVDDAPEAAAEATGPVYRHWESERGTLQEVWYLSSWTNIQLYGRFALADAWRRTSPRWDALERTGFLRGYLVVEAALTRRNLLAAALPHLDDGERRRAFVELDGLRRTLARSRVRLAAPCVAMCDCLIEASNGRMDAARQAASRAAYLAEAQGMLAMASAYRWVVAGMAGGDAPLEAEVLRSLGWRHPENAARFLAPGPWWA
ncbi:MAG: AAA family ATPase [Pseudomonadota bacterium]|nr:AAA family ATPase [Pseudomonadota bacterium]